MEKDKEKTLGKAIINLAEVASHGLDEVKELIIGKGKDKVFHLSIFGVALYRFPFLLPQKGDHLRIISVYDLAADAFLMRC